MNPQAPESPAVDPPIGPEPHPHSVPAPRDNPQSDGGASEYRVELEAYNGPLDLLLYLIRREEVDIYDIPIATVTAKFVEHVEVLKNVDPDAIGDFLVMAATLMEIKSRTLLPHPPAEVQEDEFGDPRMELVRQLLEYKKFKDAARGLGLAAEIQSLKHPRHPAVPPTESDHVDIEHVQLWDLVEAFRRLLEQTGQRQVSHEVVYDDTPIALHAADVLDSLERAGGLQLFETIFLGRSKSQMIGLFLALLELIRQKRIRACQEYPFGPISIELIDATPIRVEEDAAAEEPADTAPMEPVDAGVSADEEFEEVDEEEDQAEPLAEIVETPPAVAAPEPSPQAAPMAAPPSAKPAATQWPWASPKRGASSDTSDSPQSAIRNPQSAMDGGSDDPV